MHKDQQFSTQDILPIIFRFLVKEGFKKTAIKLQKEADFDLSTPVLNLHKKKLVKIVKEYSGHHPDTLLQLGEKLDSTQAHSKKGKLSKHGDESLLDKRKPKKKVVIDGIEEEEEIAAPKKSKKVKGKEEKPKIQTQPIVSEPKVNQPLKSGKVNFKRVDVSEYEDRSKFICTDNSFEAKIAYGQKDEYAQFGYEKLRSTQGKDFRKEKGKLKTKTLSGAITREDNTFEIL